jgi:hypothetical protein
MTSDIGYAASAIVFALLMVASACAITLTLLVVALAITGARLMCYMAEVCSAMLEQLTWSETGKVMLIIARKPDGDANLGISSRRS